MEHESVVRFIHASNGIAGWFSPSAASLFALLDEAQREMGIAGHLFEIGVHHGKSAVLLMALASPGERVGACDIFGAQGLNISQSGSGDRAAFESNVQRFAPGFDRLDIFEMPSSALDPEQIPRPVRLFHVDGGHLMEEALADIRLAAAVLHERGVIIVDDPWRMEWPGVTEAVLAFLHEDAAFRPLAAGFNKLVLCRSDCLAAYRSFIEERAWDYLPAGVYQSKRVPVAGQDTLVFAIPTYRQVPELDVKVARVREIARDLKRPRGIARVLRAVTRRLRAAVVKTQRS